MSRALSIYRVLAWIVGVWLLLLVASMVVKYGFGNATLVQVVGPIHGFLYMGYLAAAVYLSTLVHWPLGRLVLILLAGTVPFLSFVAERSVTREVRQRLAEAATTT